MEALFIRNVKQSGIYCIRNTVSGRRYVGSAVNIQQRWHSHRHLLLKGIHHSPTLLRSWLKHGESAFVFEVLELVADKNNLIEREQYWIDEFNSSDPKTGFNVAPKAGSPLGVKHSLKVRRRRSEATKGRKLPPFTAEHRAALSAARKGRSVGKGIPKSAEHRKKLSLAKMGKRLVLSQETKDRIASANRIRNKSPEMIEKVRASKLKLYSTPEGLAKLSVQSIKQWAHRRATGSKLGTPHSVEARMKMSIAKKGKMTAEHKAAIAASNRRRAVACHFS